MPRDRLITTRKPTEKPEAPIKDWVRRLWRGWQSPVTERLLLKRIVVV